MKLPNTEPPLWMIFAALAVGALGAVMAFVCGAWLYAGFA